MSTYQALEAAIDAADARSIEPVRQSVWNVYSVGGLTDDQAASLSERIEQRRGKQALPTPSTGRAVRRISIFKERRVQRARDPKASMERRRKLSQGAVPRPMAIHFTVAELAVLNVVGMEVRKHGRCDLAIDAIAAQAGVSRTTVKRALYVAVDLGFVTVAERPVKGGKNLTNVITILSHAWLRWIGVQPGNPTKKSLSKKGLRPKLAGRNSHEGLDVKRAWTPDETDRQLAGVTAQGPSRTR